MHVAATEPKESYKLNPLDDIFKDDPLEVAKEMSSAKKNNDKEEKSKTTPKRNNFKKKGAKKGKKNNKAKVAVK